MTRPVKNMLLEIWIHQIAQGNTQALEKLYYAISPSVYAYALSFLKNSYDAEDILHDCMLKIWQNASKYQPKEKPMAWILTITKNLCLKHLNNQERSLPLEDCDTPITVTCDSLSPEEKIMLADCLRMLTLEERQIMVLHAIVGYKHREIAAYMNLPLSTVLSRYRRTLSKMRTLL